MLRGVIPVLRWVIPMLRWVIPMLGGVIPTLRAHHPALPTLRPMLGACCPMLRTDCPALRTLRRMRCLNSRTRERIERMKKTRNCSARCAEMNTEQHKRRGEAFSWNRDHPWCVNDAPGRSHHGGVLLKRDADFPRGQCTAIHNKRGRSC